jgi:hypothetical protein
MDKDYKYNDNSTGKRIGFSVLIYFMLFCISSMLSVIGLLFITPEKDTFYMFMVTLGIMIWAAAIVIGVIEGVKALKEWNYSRKINYDENGRRIWGEPKEQKTYLVVEFAKAKYNKYCPKIDWTDNK